MKIRLSVVFGVVASVVGAVIGAGFISGQELVQFFVRFGALGMFGWALIALTTILGSGLALERLATLKPQSFSSFITYIFGKRVVRLAELVFNGYLIGGLVIMVSGASSLVAEALELPLAVGIAVITVAMLLVVVGKGGRLLRVNRVLIPVLITLTALVATRLLLDFETVFDPSQNFLIKNPSWLMPEWWWAVMLYLGYNAVGAVVGYINIAKEITPLEGKLGGYLGGSVVAILGTLLLITLWLTYPTWQPSELPLVYVIKATSSWLYPLFVPSMLIAMFSVGVTYTLGLANYVVERTGWDHIRTSVGLLLAVAPLSLFGFSSLLGTIYPVFGILATGLLIWLVVSKGYKNLISLKGVQRAKPV